MRLEDRRLVAVLGFLHGMVHANILSTPLFLNLAWRFEFGADDITLGLLAAIGFGFYGLSSVPFGHLADRRDPSRLLFACAGGVAAANVALAASPSITAIGLSLAALGLFSGIYHPTGLSIISRSAAEQGRAMGWHGMGGSLGIAAGPAFVGAAFAVGWSWRPVAAVLVLPAVLALVLLTTRAVPRETATTIRPSSSSPRDLATRRYALVLLVYMFAGFAYQGVLAFLPRFIDAAYFALALGLGAIGQVVSGTLADRRHPARLLFGLSLAAAGSLLVLGVTAPSGPQFAIYPPPVTPLFVVMALAFGFLLFSLEPLQNSLVTEEAPRALRGLAFGGTFLSVFGIGSLGAVVAGWLLAQGHVGVLFPILGACLAISGGIALGIRRGPRPD